MRLLLGLLLLLGQRYAVAAEKTCVLTISCWNNFAHVMTFLEAAQRSNPQINCWVWAVADRPEFYGGAELSALLTPAEKRLFASMAASIPTDLVTVVTLEELQKQADFPLLELAFKYNIVEFNTAIKSTGVKYCMDELHATKVMYFDNDCWIVDSLRPLEKVLDRVSIVVTPHIAEPMPIDGKTQTDTKIGLAGIFNFGFVAFKDSPSTRAFLRWWEIRLRFYGFVEPSKGMHFDQGWGDFIPVFFDEGDFYVARDPRYNVAYWNLHYTGANLEWDGADLWLDKSNDLKVVFVHFSGISNFNHYRPYEISRHQNRYTLADFPNLKPLLDAYMARLLYHRAREFRKLPYGYDVLDSGVGVIPEMKQLYREALEPETREFGRQSSFLNSVEQYNPFNGTLPRKRSGQSTAKVTVTQWLFEGPYNLGVDAFASSYLPHLVWECFQRDEKTPVLTDPFGADRPAIWVWFFRDFLSKKYRGKGDGLRLLAAKLFRDHEDAPKEVSFGINVVGWLDGVWGVAESSRVLFHTFCASGVPTSALNVPLETPKGKTGQGYSFFDSGVCQASPRVLPHYVNLFVVNADRTEYIEAAFPGELARVGHYNVGYWAWELPTFPDRWIDYLTNLDEVWVPSNFVRKAITSNQRYREEYSHLPITVIPLVYIPQEQHSTAAAKLDLDVAKDDFVFLVLFDYKSSPERKNVLGAVEAFAAAFPANKWGNRPRLVVKASNQEHVQFVGAAATLKRRLKAIPNSVLINRILTAEDQRALEQRADCFISMHRAEGFGLSVWRMLAGGKMGVVTNYSGVVDEVAEAYGRACLHHRQSAPCSSSKWLVDYTLIKTTLGRNYKKAGTTTWADPDLQQAALTMRSMVNQRDEHTQFAVTLQRELQRSIVEWQQIAVQRLETISSNRTDLRRIGGCTACPEGELQPALLKGAFLRENFPNFPTRPFDSLSATTRYMPSHATGQEDRHFFLPFANIFLIFLVLLLGFSPASLKRRLSPCCFLRGSTPGRGNLVRFFPL